MNYFASRERCKKCGIVNHLFVDLNAVEKNIQNIFDDGISVSYSIQIIKLNGKVKRIFEYGYSCPWCEQYNKHDTVFRAIGIK